MKRRYVYLRPYSHVMGSACLLPTTSFVVQAFASKILIYDIETPDQIIKEISLPLKGLLQQFTLIQDLEANCVAILSEEYRLYITPELEVLSKRPPMIQTERLCFGISKKQEVECIRKRRSMAEVMPFLFRLGSLLPKSTIYENRSVFSLLRECQQVLAPEKMDLAFQRLWSAGFSSFFLPQKSDPWMQNLYQEEFHETPILALLAEMAVWIRSLFITSEGEGITLLPKLPPQCVYGKCFDMRTEWGVVDFTWSKKQPFSLRLQVEKEGDIAFTFPSFIKRYRVRVGKQIMAGENGGKVKVERGDLLLLDRFEK